jgi:hypothetical protein
MPNIQPYKQKLNAKGYNLGDAEIEAKALD